ILATAIRGAAGAVGLLPVPTALALGRALGAGAPAPLRPPRRLAPAPAPMAVPELGEPARRGLVRATFGHAGQSYAELAVWRKLARNPGYVRIEGRHVLDAALAQGRGCIAITGHVGNWELLAATFADLGVPLTVVARK